MISCANVPRTIAMAINAKVATLHEMQTIYGLEDVYDMLEVVSVNNHNEHVMMKVVQ